MKYLILTLLLTGCTDISNKQINMAVEACRSNGGLNMISSVDRIYCMNGAQFDLSALKFKKARQVKQ